MGKYSANRDLDLKAKNHWYLFANRTSATIYEGVPGRHFSQVAQIENPSGKLSDTAMESDRPGRSFSSAPGSMIRHGFERKVPHHEQNVLKFIEEIIQELEKAYREEKFSDLVIVAGPHFLGLIRKALPNNMKQYLKSEIPYEILEKNSSDFENFILNQNL